MAGKRRDERRNSIGHTVRRRGASSAKPPLGPRGSVAAEAKTRVAPHDGEACELLGFTLQQPSQCGTRTRSPAAEREPPVRHGHPPSCELAGKSCLLHLRSPHRAGDPQAEGHGHGEDHRNAGPHCPVKSQPELAARKCPVIFRPRAKGNASLAFGLTQAYDS